MIWELDIAGDSTEFRFSELADEEYFNMVIDPLVAVSKPISNVWRTLYMQRSEPKKNADFFKINESDVIAMSERVCNSIDKSSSDNLELLPIKTDCGIYYLLNVLQCVDCLDMVHSRYLATPGCQIVNYSLLEFVPEKVPTSFFFRVPQLPYTVFVNDTFYDLCEANAYTGLLFEFDTNLVWYEE